MTKLLILLCFFTTFLFAQNNKGIIKGEVKTSGDRPAELVNIALKGTSLGTATDSNGKYELRNLEPSIYTIIVSFVGYKSLEFKTEVSPGEENIIPTIILIETASELGEIEVRGFKNNKFADIESEYIAKMPIRNIENPQSYSSTTKELMIEQNITDYSSALKTIPGGVISTDNPQGLSSIFIRGFQTNSYIRNGMYSFSWNGGDPQVLERVELIRGPSGPMYGTWGIGYGGLMNVVTKKPFAEKYIQAVTTFGSFNLQRFAADINLPINNEKTFLFRLNAAVHSEGSFQDYGYEKSSVIAPAFYYKINNKLNILLEAEVNTLDYSAQTLFAGASNLNINSIDQIQRDYFKSYSSHTLTHNPSKLNNYYGKINYKLSDNWKLSTNIALSDFTVFGSNVIPNFVNDTLMTRHLYDYNIQINTIAVQPNITGDFLLFNLNNRFLFGLDYQWVDVTTSASLVFVADSVNYTAPGIPILNAQELRARYNFNLYNNESRNSYAAYISNVITLARPLNLMLSLRYDYNDYNGVINYLSGTVTTMPYFKGLFSPQAGITYHIIQDKFSLFANYMQGYNYIAPDLLGNSFKPEFAGQIEGGIKLDILDNMIYSTISYYSISVDNKVRPDPSNPLHSFQDGTQISKGIDLDIRLNPISGLNIIAGYGFNNSEYTKADSAIEGNRPPGTPKNIANIWASYVFQKGLMEGIGVGAGFIYSDDYFYDDKNTLVIPSYIIVNGTIFYDAKSFRISFSAENITDERYWDYNGTPQKPVRYLASLSLNIN